MENTEQPLKRTEETANYQPDTTTQREWQAIRDECVSGGVLDERCNIVAASEGTGRLEVVQKKLSCGCILVPVDAEEIIL